MPREGSPTETGLYLEIEKHLRKQKDPLTCVDLWEQNLAVREAAGSINKLSDAMGHLWRRGFLKRTPAPKSPHNQAKWAYTWPEKAADKQRKPPSQQMRAVEEVDAPVHLPATIDGEAKTVYSKPGIEIKEEGHAIHIELPALTITIRCKE